MSPLKLFEDAWERTSHLTAIHAYLANQATGLLRTDEILRAEWAARVSALDLYVHELVAQRMVDIFEERRPPTSAYNKFTLSLDSAHRIRVASTAVAAAAAFDLTVRDQIGRQTFQYPDDIAAAIRLCSSVELWNAVAGHQGAATPATRNAAASQIRLQLSQIVQRRNKIVHEGDLQPGHPRCPWPISVADMQDVRIFIEKIVRSIDAVA